MSSSRQSLGNEFYLGAAKLQKRGDGDEMTGTDKDFYADYDQEEIENMETGEGFVDSDREYPIEARCCITGDEVKHSFCRYPDPERGTMMVMSRDTMIRFSRHENSLPAEFERVIELRRRKEKRTRRTS